jgi:uncharacterized alkaline shock family protein YloU
MSAHGLVHAGPLGRVELTSAALASLVIRSAESVAGVRVHRPRRRLRVTVEATRVHVQVGVESAVGTAVLEVGEAVQRAVAQAVTASTGLPARVDVSFEELT